MSDYIYISNVGELTIRNSPNMFRNMDYGYNGIDLSSTIHTLNLGKKGLI